MFLRYQPSSSKITYVSAQPADSSYVVPSKMNRIQISTPPKSAGDHHGGPWAAASYLEAIVCRNSGPKALQLAAIDSLIARAKTLDQACEGDNEFEIEDPYVSFFNFMKAVDENNSLVKGTLQWTTSIPALKQMIHQRGAALVEVYPTDTLINNRGWTVSAGTPLRHDYTMVLMACGLDSNGLICQNSLGLCWGKLGFASISWAALGTQLSFSGYDSDRMFLKACSFKGALSV